MNINTGFNVINGLAFAAFLLLVSGCATSKIDYIPPLIKPINNQTIVNDSFDHVWDRLVKNITSNFFTINNIDKSSRLINVSFSSNKPQEFVTCGTSLREFSNARGTQKTEYDPAMSTKYTVVEPNGMLLHIVRTSRLDGRANIYVTPSDDNKIIVIVNIKYAIDVLQEATNVYGHFVGTQKSTFDFSTKQPHDTLATEGVLCSTNGYVESLILNYTN